MEYFLKTLMLTSGIVPDEIVDELRNKKLHPEAPVRGKVGADMIVLKERGKT